MKWSCKGEKAFWGREWGVLGEGKSCFDERMVLHWSEIDDF